MVNMRTALGSHQPPIELNDPAYSELLVLGERYTYRLTERGKQLLEETGLWPAMRGMLRLLKPYEPGCRLPPLKDYVLSLGVKEICKSAVEKAVPANVLIGTLITGLQDLYVELYGLPQPETSPQVK